MQDILPALDQWRAQNQAVALATVVQTWGSSPRRIGSKMAVTSELGMAGSVSGGCVEGAVAEAGVEVLQTGRPQYLHYGVSDEWALSVGLACGGKVDVFVRPLEWETLLALRAEVAGYHQAASALVIEGPQALLGRELVMLADGSTLGSLALALDPAGLEQVITALRPALATAQPWRASLAPLQPGGLPVTLFIEPYLPPPSLVVVGGVHIAIPLVGIAKIMGYRTVVVDPRRAFGSQERFTHADLLLQSWPEEALPQAGLTANTAVTMLTHDAKIDDPALRLALPSPAFYVGALGSRKTQALRRQRLLAAGLSEADVNRLHGPIGLDLGGRQPEEIALAIMAEIVQARNRSSRAD